VLRLLAASAPAVAQRVVDHDQLPIQRSVSFTVSNRTAEPGNLVNQEIVHVNTGDRVDFIDSRLTNAGLNCAETEDVRHIVGYDLIARALRNIVKGKTVRQTAAWLANDPSWIDTANAGADRAGLAPNVPSVEDTLTMWLRNASSFSGNLFCGSAAENRSKGAQVPQAIKKVKKVASYGVEKVTNTVLGIRAIDKRSRQATRFVANGQLKTQLDFVNVPTGIREQLTLRGFLEDGLFVAYPGSVIEISLQGRGLVHGGAFHIFGGQVSRVSRAFVRPSERSKQKQNITSAKDARNRVAASQIDAPDQLTGQAAIDLMQVIGFDGATVHPIMQTGLGEKYLQRSVSLDLLDQRADVMSQEIVSVNTGSRPKVSKKRYLSCAQGLNARHKVSYDLLAKGLARTLQGATVELAAAWFDREANWLDRRYVATDRHPLDNGKTLRVLGAVEAMATRWLLNAFHAPTNLFCGNAEINQRKGRAIPHKARAVKQSWQAGAIPATDVTVMIALDKVTGKSVPLTVNGAPADMLLARHLAAINVPTLIAAPTGARLQVALTGGRNNLRWGAAYFTPVNGQLTRVGRSFRVDKATTEPGREQHRQAHLANQLDTPEPRDPEHDAYSGPYAYTLQQFEVPSARAMPVVALLDHVTSTVRQSLEARYEGEKQRARQGPRSWHQSSSPYGNRGRGSGRGYPSRQQQLPPAPVAPYYPDAEMVLAYVQGMSADQLATARNHVDRSDQIHRTYREMHALCLAQLQQLGQMDLTVFNMQSLAVRALSRPDGVVKYLPTSNPVVPNDYHRAQDTIEMREEVARQHLTEWNRGGRPIPPTIPLLTRVLEKADLQFIFGSLGLSDGELKWLKTKFHSAADGASLLIVLQKIHGARSLSDAGALATAVRAAVTSNIIRFPG
jgi:hypothetical protein